MPKISKKPAARRARAKPRARRQAPRKSDSRAVETALAGLAHEIRTSLTGILALGELLVTADLGERERAWAGAVKTTAEHLAQLTTLIVDGVKAEAAGLLLRSARFSPLALAETLAASLGARAETKGLRLDVTFADDLPAMVNGDPVRLRAALENLADNAVKFTEQGSVGLKVSAQPAQRGRVRLVFAVSDSGIGLTRAEIGRLFRPFAQASTDVAQRYGGSGLGLALVKRLARLMGGDLKVRSTPGRGSTFVLSVVVDKATAPSAPSKEIQSQLLGSTRSLKILCAEDNPYGRVILNTILTELGHRTDFVGSGEAAIAAVARGGYDVVLMDIVLSGTDGIEATRRIRALAGAAARIPMIGISGRTEFADAAAARSAGMDLYLSKPVSPAALAQALATVASGKAG